MKDFLLVIPARYKSTRFPGKPLKEIDGKPMLLRTYDQCLKAVKKENIIVATDDERISKFCKLNSIAHIETSSNCLTGTDRVAEVAEKIVAKRYINVQADEPVIDPLDIKKVLNESDLYPNLVHCGFTKINNESEYNSLSCPKVVTDLDNFLLYMSRAPIPGNKHSKFEASWRQVCVYAFPYKSLISFKQYGGKSPLEKIEDIEILRFLEIGERIRMVPVSDTSIAVDFPEDIKKVEDYLKKEV